MGVDLQNVREASTICFKIMRAVVNSPLVLNMTHDHSTPAHNSHNVNPIAHYCGILWNVANVAKSATLSHMCSTLQNKLSRQ